VSEISRIAHLTYSLQHNPNCPSKYLIRLAGDDSGIIDNRSYSSMAENQTKDRLFFGVTLAEAIDKALADEKIALRRRMSNLQRRLPV
jgi:hypothetical protein